MSRKILSLLAVAAMALVVSSDAADAAHCCRPQRCRVQRCRMVRVRQRCCAPINCAAPCTTACAAPCGAGCATGPAAPCGTMAPAGGAPVEEAPPPPPAEEPGAPAPAST